MKLLLLYSGKHKRLEYNNRQTPKIGQYKVGCNLVNHINLDVSLFHGV